MIIIRVIWYAACYYSITWKPSQIKRNVRLGIRFRCYDPGDNLNMYGSPIYTEQLVNNNNIDKEQPGPSNVVLDRRMLSLTDQMYEVK
jgi:hypothetical protein